MPLFLEGKHRWYNLFFFSPLGQIFSASQWITGDCRMLKNGSEGRGFWCWLAFSVATLIMHGMCGIWNLVCNRGVSYSPQIYRSLEHPMCRNYFDENQSSTLNVHKKAQEDEDQETISSFEYIFLKLLFVWHNLCPACIRSHVQTRLSIIK